MTCWPFDPRPAAGFTLIEMSLVLLLFGLLAGGSLSTLYGWQNQLADTRASSQLDNAQEALYGHAISHGRLPCPADGSLSHDQIGAGLENCTLEHGVLPWRSLGLPETDPWGQRLSYFAHATFTAPLNNGARAAFTLDSQGNAYVRPSASANSKDADSLPAVLVSHGRNGLGGYRHDGRRSPTNNSDEQENADADLAFVSQRPSPSFDDQVRWLSSDILKSRLLAAARLP
ncbi:MAG: prepilin-type N-terminal cleavage/methylation domain-containing protein [Dechloromonas sp.]|nr:prepilin-type N-terminal cleavage/methylation domain-containing protein [Dechloromonas sp.]